jgi:hypothetical protein
MILILLFDLNFQMLCMGQVRKFKFKSNRITTDFYDKRQNCVVSPTLRCFITFFQGDVMHKVLICSLI